MRLKKFFVGGVGGYVLVQHIWYSAALKIFAMPIAVLLLISKSRETFCAIALGLLSTSIYFFVHGYAGSHDLKALLLVLHFLIPTAIFHYAKVRRIIRRGDMFGLLSIFLVLSVLNQGSFNLNGLASEEERFRGFILFPLLALMQVCYRGTLQQRLALAISTALVAFMISGSRQDSALLFVSGLVIALRKDYLLIVIPIAYALMPIFTVIYSYILPYAHDTIAVRGGSAVIAFNGFNLFGNGMALPVVDFLAANDFNHFFVPADVMYFGSIYETGLIIFLLKSAFIVRLAYLYWGRVPNPVIAVAGSVALLDYNLTHMAFEFAASAVVFKYLKRLE